MESLINEVNKLEESGATDIEIAEFVRGKLAEHDYSEGVDGSTEITQFYMKMLELNPSLIDDFPTQIQREIILQDDRYLDFVFDKEKLFEDEAFTKELIDGNNDLITKMANYRVNSEYIKDLTTEYIKGERTPDKGSKLEKMSPKSIYVLSVMDVKEDRDLASYLLEQDINYLPTITGCKEIRDNPENVARYVAENPWELEKYLDKIAGNWTPELVESVLKRDFSNYRFIDENSPAMKQFYTSLEDIRKYRPELKLDNPSLRYELLCDQDFISMDPNIINSLLEYSNGNVDKVIQIKNEGNLEHLYGYIDKYNSLYGNNLENIQHAISSFDSIQDLLLDVGDIQNLEIEEDKLKTIIATRNKFGINTAEDVVNYDEIVEKYYKELVEKAKTPKEIKDIYCGMLFNSTEAEFEDFIEEYCNSDFEGLENYAKSKKQDNPISEELKRRIDIFEKLKDIESVEQARELFSQMPLEICDVKEVKNSISNMYSQAYDDEMLDLSDESLEHGEYNGVPLIKLNGEEFNLCIHRIYNFDFDMTGISNAIIEDPKQWNLQEGSTTVSTSLITDKKIAGVFSQFRKTDTTLDMIEDEEQYEQERQALFESIKRIQEGRELREIDDTAVFYGFTELPSSSIIKMDSKDMMTEHGSGKLDSKTHKAIFRGTEDLAYWTEADMWNEVALKRKETNVDRASQAREKVGSDRMQPSCIVCFDGNINEQSLSAARSHNIPLLMIDRQQYLDINEQRLEEARQEFSETLSPESIKDIFYRQPYHMLVDEIPKMLETIKRNNDVSAEKKEISTEYLESLAQHFIEQSKGTDYLCGNVPIEELNEKVEQNLRTIGTTLKGKDTQDLGRETISEQQNTQEKDAVEQVMNEQERAIRDSKDNTQIK